MTAAALTAARAGLVSCEACQLLSRPPARNAPGYCRRCGEKLEFRRHRSIETTWALIIAAAICYIPANVSARVHDDHAGGGRSPTRS